MNQPARVPWWNRVSDFLVDHRVAISFVVFSWLIGQNLILGHQPRNLGDFHDLAAVLGVALILGGLGLRSCAAGTLRKGKALTTTGPYRYCRHPLYLGSLMMMTGFGLLVPSVTVFWAILGLILVIYLVTMRREERRLAVRYGPAWDGYVAHGPRLFPLRLPRDLLGDWSFAQWFRSREYKAVLTTLAALAAIQLWHGYSGTTPPFQGVEAAAATLRATR